jgi:hypothetical protein
VVNVDDGVLSSWSVSVPPGDLAAVRPHLSGWRSPSRRLLLLLRMRITQGMIGMAATAYGVFRGLTSPEPRS